MGVHEGVDRRGGGTRGPHLVQHLSSQLQVEKRVDQQRRLAACHQAGVAPSPGAVGLEVGEAAVSDFVEPFRVLPILFRHLALLPGFLLGAIGWARL